MTYTFDTSGGVAMQWPDGREYPCEWPDRNPFAQGYLRAAISKATGAGE